MHELGMQAETTQRPMSGLDHDVHPEQYPESRRELQIASGAFESLKMTVNELLERVADYTRDTEPSPEKMAVDPSMPCRSPYGRELRGLSDSIGALERRVRGTLNLLEL